MWGYIANFEVFGPQQRHGHILTLQHVSSCLEGDQQFQWIKQCPPSTFLDVSIRSLQCIVHADANFVAIDNVWKLFVSYTIERTKMNFPIMEFTCFS